MRVPLQEMTPLWPCCVLALSQNIPPNGQMVSINQFKTQILHIVNWLLVWIGFLLTSHYQNCHSLHSCALYVICKYCTEKAAVVRRASRISPLALNASRSHESHTTQVGYGASVSSQRYLISHLNSHRCQPQKHLQLWRLNSRRTKCPTRPKRFVQKYF